jgi:deoxyribose-phosphate aldolase
MASFPLPDGIDLTNIDEEVKIILREEPLLIAPKEALREIFSFLDYTSLDGADNTGTITRLCRKARSFGEAGVPYPSAVCIYPPFIAVAREVLTATSIRIATVAAAFPHGQLPLSAKLREVEYAVEEGADEIDVVISRGTFLEGAYNEVFHELQQIRAAAGEKTLKVILETGELGNPENIARASLIAIEAGADFIKTSTGKISPAATEEAVYVMLKVIRAFYQKTGKRIGIKPAGGIAEPAKALNYYRLVQKVLGPEWLCSNLFRIGASRLADKIIEEIGQSSTQC